MKWNKVNEHDNNRNERVSNTHGKGERVKITPFAKQSR